MKALIGFLYWFTCGALIGLGLVMIFSIGLPLLLLGGVFILYRTRKVGDRGWWAAAVGLGAAPATLMFVSYLASNPCPPGGNGISVVVGPGESFGCSYLSESFVYQIAIFAAIALAGLAWGLFERLQRRHR